MEKEYSEEELEEIVKWLIEIAGDKRVWLLTGFMGAGKTTLVSALMKVLSCEDEVSSPTYAIINEYRIDSALSPFHTVWHADLYRLQDISEALDAGVEEMINNEAIWSIIEWPQIILPYLPKNNTVSLELQILSEQKRLIKVNF